MPASVDEAIRARVAVQEFSVKRVTKLFFDWIAKVEDKAVPQDQVYVVARAPHCPAVRARACTHDPTRDAMLPAARRARHGAPAHSEALLGDLVKELLKYQTQMEREATVVEREAHETRRYGALAEEIEGKIDSTQTELASLREEWEEERVRRRHREEYEQMKRLINEMETRAETQASIAQVEAEIGAIDADAERSQSHLDLRKKQFHLLLHTLHALQADIDAA